MAVFRPSPLVLAASGTIGGTTFANTKAGLVARRAKPPGPPQPHRGPAPGSSFARAQLPPGGVIPLARSQWDALTDAQRADWAAWAIQRPRRNRVDLDRPLAAFPAFVSAVWPRFFALPIPVTTPGFVQPPSNDTPITVTIALSASLSTGIVLSGSPFLFQNWILVRGARAFRAAPALRIPTTLFYTFNNFGLPAFTLDLTSRFIGFFGSPAVGETIAVDVQLLNPLSTVSPRLRLTALTTA